MKKNGILAVCLSLCLLIISLMSGCTRLNDKPPACIKSIVSYGGADRLAVYFVLADSSGAMTTANGTVDLTIYEAFESNGNKIGLFSKSFDVKKTDFKKVKFGTGVWEHKEILYPVGRIAYSSFVMKPSVMTGIIKLSFKVAPYGDVLNGEKTIIF